MKYTKTYDSFISNLFTKRKKLPTEVIQLAEKLTNIISLNIPDTCNVFYKEHTSRDKKNDNMIGIYIDPDDLGGEVKVIGLYYNSELKRLMYIFIRNLTFMENIEEFLTNIMESLCDLKKTTRTSTNEQAYLLYVDNINNVIKEITQENYVFFLDTKKYNL